jgi:hypothetical protein
MNFYVVTARVVYETDGREETKSVLPFFLSERQVRNEYQAEELGRHIVDPLGLAKVVHVHATATPMLEVDLCL